MTAAVEAERMTQTQPQALYGPVAEDLILVEDLLESVEARGPGAPAPDAGARAGAAG